MDKTPLNALVSTIARNQLWASDEETEAWLKTPSGQQIAALIAERRRELGPQRAG